MMLVVLQTVVVRSSTFLVSTPRSWHPHRCRGCSCSIVARPAASVGGEDRSRNSAAAASSSSSNRSRNSPSTKDIMTGKPTSSEGILGDAVGRVNRELAERIWNWEQEHRQSRSLPQLDYSIRSALKLVDEWARDEGQRQDQFRHRALGGKPPASRDDLVQDGLAALLDALGEYDGPPNQFEEYARQRLSRRFQTASQNDSTVDDDNAIRMPRSVHDLLDRAQKLAKNWRSQQLLPSKPTVSRLAAALGVSSDRLRDALQLAATLRRNRQRQRRKRRLRPQQEEWLSVERTVEVWHPHIGDGSSEYRDQDEWELSQGFVLDTGNMVDTNQLVEDYVDEMLWREGDDEAWIRQEETAGPLQELVPDEEDDDNIPLWTPDDQEALRDVIRNDLGAFLTGTLDPSERLAVNLAFGLEAGRLPVAGTALARELDMPPEHASRLLSGAIAKLRAAYRNRYLEPSTSDDDDDVEGDGPALDSV